MGKSKASIVVGVDFGPTFSSFAFAFQSKPVEVRMFDEWPDVGAAGGGHSCKTSTSLFYNTAYCSGPFVLKDWGYSAPVKYASGNQSKHHEQDRSGEATYGVGIELPVPVEDLAWRTGTRFLSLFKIYIGGDEHGIVSAAKLPDGLTVRRVISDYLRELSQFVMRKIQCSIGSHWTMQDVQWCLTVPAIWDDILKKEMEICASIAGMTKSPGCPPDLMLTASPHPLLIVIDQEAATYYLQSRIQFSLKSAGNKFLIVDVDGGDVDLVLDSKSSGGFALTVQNLARGSGGLFGGSLVDKAFFDFLSGKISCVRKFSSAHPQSTIQIKRWWETIKYAFDGEVTYGPYQLELPTKLACAWEADESSKKRSFSVAASYHAIELSSEDMQGLFDPIVDDILRLIKSSMIVSSLEPIDSKMSECLNFEAMMIIGSFAGSPYLEKRIRQEFSAKTWTTVFPREPGSILCCGAVICGLERARGFMV